MRSSPGSAFVAVLGVLAAAAASACGGSARTTPTPSALATESAANTGTPTLTLTSTLTPTQTPVPTPTHTPTPTPFVMPTPRPGWRADGSRSAMALTFDTDDALGYTAAILDTLEAYGVHASFAVTGLWAQAHPALLQRIVRDGDTVMNHSWDHPDFTKITTQQRLLELQRTDDAVRAAAGITTKPYFRPPYGALDAAVQADAAQAGYLIVRWNIDPKGWSGMSGLKVQANVYQNARNGGIVLAHVSAYGDYAALSPIIQTLSDAGYRFVTIAEMVPPPPPTPTPSPTPSATATPTRVPSATPSLTPQPRWRVAPATATPSRQVP